MTTLYLLRHGIAVERGVPDCPDDSERPLTPEGEQKVRRIAKALRGLEVELDVLLTSPFARAHRTAEIVAQEFRAKQKLEICDGLAVGGDPGAIFRQLHQHHRSVRNVMLVGHEPCLSELASVLLTGHTGLALTFKKGGLAKLSATRLHFGRCASLEWLLTPKVLGNR